MSLRVTERSIAANYLLNLNKTRERIITYQTQLASGKRVNTVSDDPAATDTILRLKGILVKNEQWQTNAVDGQAMVEQTEQSLDEFGKGLLEMKEMLVRVKSGVDPEVLDSFAERFDHLLTNMVDIANTKFNGKYVFGGTNTLDPPFILAADRSTVTLNPNGITGDINYNVGEGIYQKVNIDGQEAFQGTAIFQRVIAVRDALRAGTLPPDADIDAINQGLEYVTGIGAKAGAMYTNLTAVEARLADQELQMAGLLSQNQDSEIAETTLRLKHEEIMLDAALNTGGRIIPKSLLDYLR